MNKSDLKERFGRLVVLKELEERRFPCGKKYKILLCRCDCGAIKNISSPNLQSGRTKSCGCIKKEVNKKRITTHGMAKTKIYRVYMQMKDRCGNKNNNKYKYYGERGIKVSPRWDNFINFFEDTGLPKKGGTLDRVDNSKGYSKENCKWVTRMEQANNTRRNIYIKIGDETNTLSQWCRILNENYSTAYARHKKGQPVFKQKALELYGINLEE